MEVTKHIAIFRNAIGKDVCERLIAAAEEKDLWSKSLTGGQMDSSYRSNKEFHLSKYAANYADLKVFDDTVYQAMNKAVVEYQRAYSNHAFVFSDEGYSILRYGGGEEYQVHTDSGVENKRLVSGLLYLNEGFEGGETDFPLQNHQVKPEAGMICLFPSIFTHPHASLPVKSGIKFVIVTWFRGFS